MNQAFTMPGRNPSIQEHISYEKVVKMAIDMYMDCARGATPAASDDDDDTVLIIGSVVGAAAGLALVAGGYALYSKQGSAEKEEPLLGQERA